MVSMHDLKIAGTHAGKDCGRYAVNGVQVKAGGVLVATDSRRMLRITPSKPDATIERDALVPLKGIPTITGKAAQSTTLHVNGTVAWSGPNGSGSLDTKAELTGDFPDADRIYPKVDSGSHRMLCELNPAFLADAAKAVDDFLKARPITNPRVIPAMSIHYRDNESAVVLRAVAENGDCIEVLLMPITTN